MEGSPRFNSFEHSQEPASQEQHKEESAFPEIKPRPFNTQNEAIEKYGLTEERILSFVEQKPAGEKFTRASMIETFVGNDYGEMTQGEKNTIFMLMEGGIQHAVKKGVLSATGTELIRS